MIDSEGDDLLRLSQETKGKDSLDKTTDELIPEPLEYLVSLKALCLVSPVIQTMLNGGFKKGGKEKLWIYQNLELFNISASSRRNHIGSEK